MDVSHYLKKFKIKPDLQGCRATHLIKTIFYFDRVSVLALGSKNSRRRIWSVTNLVYYKSVSSENLG